MSSDDPEGDRTQGNPSAAATESEDNYVACTMCHKFFKEQIYLEKHVKRKHQPDKECKTSLDSDGSGPKQVSRNINTIECTGSKHDSKNMNRISCTVCSEQFVNITEYTHHLKVHLDTEKSSSRKDDTKPETQQTLSFSDMPKEETHQTFSFSDMPKEVSHQTLSFSDMPQEETHQTLSFSDMPKEETHQTLSFSDMPQEDTHQTLSFNVNSEEECHLQVHLDGDKSKFQQDDNGLI